jgi:hypothetical protein
VLHVALRGLDQVRDQVVATLELHVDLRIRVLVTVSPRDEPVVRADHEQRQNDQRYEESNRDPHRCLLGPGSSD